MLNETRDPILKSRYYQIKVEGVIDASWSEWLGCLHIVPCQDERGQAITSIGGEFSDQAALRGLMNRLWDLNLVLLSIQSLDPNTDHDHSEGGF